MMAQPWRNRRGHWSMECPKAITNGLMSHTRGRLIGDKGIYAAGDFI